MHFEHSLTPSVFASAYAQTSGARIQSPTNSSRLPPGSVKFSIQAPPLSGSGMVKSVACLKLLRGCKLFCQVMELRVMDFLVSEVTEDVAVILNDMPEGW